MPITVDETAGPGVPRWPAWAITHPGLRFAAPACASGQEAQMPAVRYPIEIVNGVPVVAAPEEIDASNADWLRTTLLETAARGHATFVVDMTGTRLCASAGLGALVRAHKRALAEGGELLLVIPHAAVLRIFALTCTDRMIPNFISLDDALTHMSPGGSNGRRRPDDGPEGSAAKTTGTTAQPAAADRATRRGTA